MALDPTISLQVKGPQINGADSALDQFGKIAGIAGQVTSIAGAQQTQGAEGLGAFMKMLPAAYDNPHQLGELARSTLAGMSPAARIKAAPMIDTLVRSLTDGLPVDDPTSAREIFNERLTPKLLAAGVPPTTIYAFQGKLPPQVHEVPQPDGSTKMMVVGSPLTGPGATERRGAPEGQFRPSATAGLATGGPTSALHPTGDNSGPLVNPLVPRQFADSSGRAGTTIGQGPDTVRDAVMQGEGLTYKKAQDEADTIAKALPSSARAIHYVDDALKHFSPGAGADFRASVASGLQFLRNTKFPGSDAITPKMIEDVGNDGFAAKQIFDSVVKPMLMRQLTETAQGQGKIMLPEVEAMMSTLSSNMDPRAINAVMNKLKQQIRSDAARSEAFYKGFRPGVADKGSDVNRKYGAGGFNQYFIDNFPEEKHPMKVFGYDMSDRAVDEKATGAEAPKNPTEKMTKDQLLRMFRGQ